MRCKNQKQRFFRGWLPHSILVRALCRGMGLVPPAEEGSAWSIHLEQEHVSLVCVPSGMGKVGGKEAGSRILVFNSNFVCNPVMFITEILQGLGRRCILHGQNSLPRVAQLLQALFDSTHALFPSLSPPFLPFLILLQVKGLIA